MSDLLTVMERRDRNGSEWRKMGRKFNIAGSCNPQKHYMVRLDERLKRIKEDYVDEGSYFTINRGRQYGKTTILAALERYLGNDYTVLSLDFQEIGTEDFADASVFVKAFAGIIIEAYEFARPDVDKEIWNLLAELAGSSEEKSLKDLFVIMSRMCAKTSKPIVLMIDEVDSASNNQVFIDFLAMLRGYYLARDKKAIFQSVILAGVYDVKLLKLKLGPEDEHKYNSPWNIAAKFNINMNFSLEEIAAMLEEYESDHHTGMKINAVAEEIYHHTSGYPYLVSAICKYIDDEIADSWTVSGVMEAVKLLLFEQSPLFGNMIRHVNEYPNLKNMLYAMLFLGERVSYSPDNRIIELASMFGYTVNDRGSVRVANRIFETRLYNYFLSEEELASAMSRKAKLDRNQFLSDGRLHMERVIEKFVVHFTDIYGDNDERFVEEYGRKFFLLYLRPIINGVGNYYVEAQTRDAKRTDVIITEPITTNVLYLPSEE